MDGNMLISIEHVIIRDPLSALSSQAREEYAEDSLMSVGQHLGQYRVVMVNVRVTVEHYYLA